jgi:hypothetical protein
MSRQAAAVVYVATMVVVIVGVDIIFFRDRLLERLLANIGIVFAFAALYFAFLRHR